MSKPSNKILLVPGTAGWEIWTGQADSGFALHEATNITRAGDLSTLPAGDVSLLFPVKSITAVPLKVTTEDEALFPELAAMHAERLGLRPDPMAGQLTDTFVIAREGESTALLAIHLRPPADGELPTRSPKEFDVSARAFPTTGECLTIWQEFGRWVFAFHHQGKTVYCQATSVSTPDPGDELVREIRLAQIQLSLQGMELEPTTIHVWSADAPDTTAISSAFRCRIHADPRPAPVLPSPRSRLLPADVRAARRAAQKRRTIIATAAAIALAYLGVIGYFAQGLWKTSQQTKQYLQRANQLAPDAADYQTFLGRWDELSRAVDTQYSPIETLYLIHKCIPKTGGLRLKSAEITADEITLVGEAQQQSAVSNFSLALTRSKDLSRYKWQVPAASQSKGGWEFTYNAAPPKN